MTELGTDRRNTCKGLLFARRCIVACSLFSVSNRSQCTIHAAQGQFEHPVFKDVAEG